MNHQTQIAEMEAALREAGATVGDLCIKADISPSTWSRWKRDVAPRPKLWRKVRGAFAVLTSADAGAERAA